ncbi:MAG: DMT family transporter [Thermoplasmata archaeon]
MYCKPNLNSEKTVPVALTTLAAFLWGSEYAAISLGLRTLSPFWFATLRSLTAILVIAIFIFIFQKKFKGNIKKMISDKIVWLLGILNGLGFIFQFLGMTETTASKAVLIININVVTTAILSSKFLGERLWGKKYAALLVGSIGVLLLTTDGNFSKLEAGSIIGDILVFIGGFIWSCFVVVQKKYIPSNKEELAQHVLAISAITALVTAIPAIMFEKLPTLKVNEIYIVLYLGIFTTALPYYIWIFALRKISATFSSVILLLQIFFGIFLAAIFLAETLSIAFFVGGALIVSSIFLTSVE